MKSKRHKLSVKKVQLQEISIGNQENRLSPAQRQLVHPRQVARDLINMLKKSVKLERSINNAVYMDFNAH